jgi:hypothetical protein
MRYGLEKRLEQAASRFRSLGRIWWAKGIGLSLKMKIYRAGVASVALYGSECWCLDEGTERLVSSWNARRVSTLTGRSIKEEYKDPTWSLVKAARLRRVKWLGKVIRREEDFLVRQFILAEADNHGNKVRGSILNDIPHIENARDLVTMAEDLEGWSEIMDNI